MSSAMPSSSVRPVRTDPATPSASSSPWTNSTATASCSSRLTSVSISVCSSLVDSGSRPVGGRRERDLERDRGFGARCSPASVDRSAWVVRRRPGRRRVLARVLACGAGGRPGRGGRRPRPPPPPPSPSPRPSWRRRRRLSAGFSRESGLIRARMRASLRPIRPRNPLRASSISSNSSSDSCTPSSSRARSFASSTVRPVTSIHSMSGVEGSALAFLAPVPGGRRGRGPVAGTVARTPFAEPLPEPLPGPLRFGFWFGDPGRRTGGFGRRPFRPSIPPPSPPEGFAARTLAAARALRGVRRGRRRRCRRAPPPWAAERCSPRRRSC